MSCTTDFCPTCPNAGNCDLSCGICGHRRAQVGALDECDLDTFTAYARNVTVACCDPGTGGCDETGDPPAECDARCAVVYTDFFIRCGNALRAFLPSSYGAYQRLQITCLVRP
jgi:hypothetical protein